MSPVKSIGAAPGRWGVPLTQPGRASLEWAVMFAATALLFPETALLSALFARRAKRQGSPRGLAAMIAAVWCGLLGVIVRLHLHAGIVP